LGGDAPKVGFSEIGINFDKIRRFGYHSFIPNRYVRQQAKNIIDVIQ